MKDGDFKMLIGQDNLDKMLEIGIVESKKCDYIVHAMKARYKYRKMRKWDSYG